MTTPLAAPSNGLAAPTQLALPSAWQSHQTHPTIIRYRPLVAEMLDLMGQTPYPAMPEGVRRYKKFLGIVGTSIINPFWCSDQHGHYKPEPSDQHFEIKSKLIAALVDLAKQIPAIPGLVWHAIAYIASRQNPFEEDSLLLETEDHFIMGDAKDNDTALHAAALVTSFMGFIQDTLAATIGVNIVHGCKCGCCIVHVDPATSRHMPRRPTEAEIKNWSDSVMSHLVTEGVKTKILDLPFILKF